MGSANLFMGNARVVGNMIYSGVPERFPDVKFVSVESGVGWLPFFLEVLDHQMAETAPNELAELSMPPSDYFRRQFYGCFWFERSTVRPTLEYVGAQSLMFETDFPHPTCLDPPRRPHPTLKREDPPKPSKASPATTSSESCPSMPPSSTASTSDTATLSPSDSWGMAELGCPTLWLLSSMWTPVSPDELTGKVPRPRRAGHLQTPKYAGRLPRNEDSPTARSRQSKTRLTPFSMPKRADNLPLGKPLEQMSPEDWTMRVSDAMLRTGN